MHLNRSILRKSVKLFAASLPFSGLVILFQNCSGGFQANSALTVVGSTDTQTSSGTVSCASGGTRYKVSDSILTYSSATACVQSCSLNNAPIAQGTYHLYDIGTLSQCSTMTTCQPSGQFTTAVTGTALYSQCTVISAPSVSLTGPSSISNGNTASLIWAATSASGYPATVTMNGVVVTKSPFVTPNLTVDTTYTLTATNFINGILQTSTVSFTVKVQSAGSGTEPQSALFTADTASKLINPERGWYDILQSGQDYCASPGVPSPLLLKYIAGKQPETGSDGTPYQEEMKVFYYIWNPTTQDPSVVANDLACVRAAGAKIIFTEDICANDFNGCDTGQSVASIQAFGSSIKPILFANSDVLYDSQCGFIGPWGEWHDSGSAVFNTEAGRTAVRDICLDMTPPEITVSFRDPWDLMYWYNSQTVTAATAFNQSPLSRVLIANGCALAGTSDSGTYLDGPFTASNVTDITIPFSAFQQRTWASNQSLYTGQHWEPCPSGSWDGPTPNRTWCGPDLNHLDSAGFSTGIVAEGPRYHVTTIHRGYDSTFETGWINGGCYDQVANLMGYRFQFDSLNHASTATHGTNIVISLNMHNYGWARILQKRQVKVTLTKSGATDITCFSDYDLRELPPQSSSSSPVTIICPIPSTATTGAYSVNLSMPDQHAAIANNRNYMIQPANKSVGAQTWNDSTGQFATGTTITIN